MKLLRKAAVAVLVCICVAGCLIGCSSKVHEVTASQRSYSGDYTPEKLDNLKINVKFKSAYATGSGTNFYSESTLPELKEQIDNQKQKDYSLETKIYGENFLLVDKKVEDICLNQHVYHYLVVRFKRTNEGGWRYELMHLEETFIIGEGKNIDASWSIPYHLFGDTAYEELLSSGGGFFDFEGNRAYPSEHGIDEFYDFYKAIEDYYVCKEENVLTLERIGNGQKHTIDIRFNETENGTTVTYFNSAVVE